MTCADEIRNRLDKVIGRVCRERVPYVKHPKDFIRNRTLGMEQTVRLLLSMEGGALNKEMYKQGVSATPSAFSQARAKLKPQAFRDIMARFNHVCEADNQTFCGYRVFAVDGSCINMARNAQAQSYVKSGDYNQLHLNVVFDIQSKIYVDAEIQVQPKADEIGALIQMLKRGNFRGDNLFIMDRGYESYNLWAHLIETKVDFLCRVKQKTSAMKKIVALPMTEFDTKIKFTITTTQTNEDKRKGYIFVQTPSKKQKSSSTSKYSRFDFPTPYTMQLRVVRTRLETGEFETLVTTLPDCFETEDIPYLYHNRWGIETSFRALKFDQGLINLHGKSESYVRQEIYAAMVMSNFASRITGVIEIPQTNKKIHHYQLNFKMATFLCREFFRDKSTNGELLLKNIRRYILPVRPGRADTRKLRPKGFVGFVYRIAA